MAALTFSSPALAWGRGTAKRWRGQARPITLGFENHSKSHLILDRRGDEESAAERMVGAGKTVAVAEN
jgi:hypothetical protein